MFRVRTLSDSLYVCLEFLLLSESVCVFRVPTFE